MGYFSNGTEGMMYEEQYCSKCVHREGPDGKSGCHVWLAHLLYAHKECGTSSAGEEILELLIPHEKDSHFSGKCNMFYGGEPEKSEPVKPMPAMREWAKKHGLQVA